MLTTKYTKSTKKDKSEVPGLSHRAAFDPYYYFLFVSFVLFVVILIVPATAMAQPSPADDRAEAVLSELTAEQRAAQVAGDGVHRPSAVPLLDLIVKGGWLMVPIGVMSIIVVAIGIERYLGLRRSRVLPRALVSGLGDMADRDQLDPRSAYRLCQRYPSSASKVIQAMLLKVGRPHSEVEHAVAEECQAEADRMYSNVRTLNLAAAITPLMGLLGTVWGMIQSFFVTANLPLGSNKGQALAEGIYVALITTFAGLAVAIPAAVLAHLYEGRILNLVRDIESLLASLLPHVERYEGKLRVDQASLSRPVEKDSIAMERPEVRAS
jgi:biopolymer transport protein ExbB